MLRCFKSGQKKEDETSSPFKDNGSALLKELITTFNGRQEIPIRCYTAEELITATNNFADMVLETYCGYIYRGSMNERQVLVKTEGNIRDIAITSQMSQLKNVLKLSGCCLEFEYPALVYEYVEFETLYDRFHNNDNFLPWRNRKKIALDIASTVLYLHTSFQTPIIHRDLNPSKVIIDQHGVAKLFDFSLSISLPHGESQVEVPVQGQGTIGFVVQVQEGTRGYLDPEYLISGFVTQKSDVYCFGVILLQLVTGKRCFDMNYEGGYIVSFVKDHFEKDQLSQIIDPKIVEQGFVRQQQLRAILDLAIRCTHFRGEDRPEMIQVARELRQIEKSVNC